MTDIERLPRYEIEIKCGTYCQGGTPFPVRTDEEYPQYHDWNDSEEYCKAADVAKLEEEVGRLRKEIGSCPNTKRTSE